MHTAFYEGRRVNSYADTQKYPYIQIIHVGGEELPGRTCVPDQRDRKYYGGPETNGVDVSVTICHRTAYILM